MVFFWFHYIVQGCQWELIYPACYSSGNSIGILVTIQDVAQFIWSVAWHHTLSAWQGNVLNQIGWDKKCPIRLKCSFCIITDCVGRTEEKLLNRAAKPNEFGCKWKTSILTCREASWIACDCLSMLMWAKILITLYFEI